MHQNPNTPDLSYVSIPAPGLRPVLAVMSIVTLLTSISQALTIRVGHQAAGVSIVTWGTDFASAVLWFWLGLRKATRTSICLELDGCSWTISSFRELSSMGEGQIQD